MLRIKRFNLFVFAALSCSRPASAAAPPASCSCVDTFDDVIYSFVAVEHENLPIVKHGAEVVRTVESVARTVLEVKANSKGKGPLDYKLISLNQYDKKVFFSPNRFRAGSARTE